MTKHTPGFALEALMQDLAMWKDAGSQDMHFDTLASHPETDDGCTFGDLIEPAAKQAADLGAAARDILKGIDAGYIHLGHGASFNYAGVAAVDALRKALAEGRAE